MARSTRGKGGSRAGKSTVSNKSTVSRQDSPEAKDSLTAAEDSQGSAAATPSGAAKGASAVEATPGGAKPADVEAPAPGPKTGASAVSATPDSDSPGAVGSDSLAGAESPVSSTVEDTWGSDRTDTLTGADGPSDSDTMPGDDPLAAADTLAGEDTLWGSDTLAGADTLTGDDPLAAADTLAGADTLSGEDSPAGDDTLTGAEGASGAETMPGDDPLAAADTLPGEDSLSSSVEDTWGAERGDRLGGAGVPAEDPVTGAEDDTRDLPQQPAALEDSRAPAQPAATTDRRSGGFLPLVLGGVVAAGLGFAAGAYTDVFARDGAEDPFFGETRSAQAAQDERLAALDKTVSALDERLGAAERAAAEIDTAPLSTAISGLQDSVAAGETGLTDLGAALTALDERLTTLEKAPVEDTVSPEAIAAYERELDALRAEIAKQSAAIAAEREEIEALAAEAMEAEAQADAKAILAESRAALAELTARVQDGRPFAEPLTILQENAVSVPAVLEQSAETGVPTVVALVESFPEPARVALRTARSGQEGEGGIGSFLQNQLGVRSVAPREGDDPDAVLSRAEAAVQQGDIETALTELQALPPEAQADMADWTAAASQRRDALEAAKALGAELTNEQGSE